MISFENTHIAFAHLSRKDLRRAHFLFLLISKAWLVKMWHFILNIAIKLRFPIKWIIKPTIYQHFVGGETLQDCLPAIEKLWKQRVFSILDYSAEGKSKGYSTESNYNQLVEMVYFAIATPHIAFTVFKPTGLIDTRILTLVSEKTMLNREDEASFEEFKKQVNNLCDLAYKGNKPILIDAEDSWYQSAIDDLADEMMAKYNSQKAIVFRTFQLYRTNMLGKLIQSHRKSISNGYILGAKIVRGAYMEKERDRALKMGYESPIHENKAATDRDFNEALKFALSNIESISTFCGTHNKDSIIYLISLMESLNINRSDERIFFSQLYGMSDSLSFNLADTNYNVAKYVPYGPVLLVMPYLFRRAEENTSVRGQSSRELNHIKKELKRRKYEKEL